MAQWDDIGNTQDWGDYYAGRRAVPPASKLMDSNSERTAWEWAIVTMNIDNERAARFAAHCAEHGIAQVIR